MNDQYSLTIAIPTFNRAEYLELNLRRLAEEMATTDPGAVEVLVSDNCSTDHTQSVVERAIASGLPVRYVRNSENIGSDANIAQCFNLAKGHYVQLLGDDDVYYDGTLSPVLAVLRGEEFGAICLRPYGYDFDYRSEYPGGGGEEQTFLDVGDFLSKIGPLVTFISSCVINRRVLQNVDARQFCGTNLVQVHLLLRAALLVRRNLFIGRYIMACKRNNSGGYDFSEVFVERLGKIFDSYVGTGLTQRDIDRFEHSMLLWYFPQYLLRMRLAGFKEIQATHRRFDARFSRKWMYHVWVAPILNLPRPLALLWGGATALIGRLLIGDGRRGLHFILVRLRAWKRR